jgi:hypothetical protein
MPHHPPFADNSSRTSADAAESCAVRLARPVQLPSSTSCAPTAATRCPSPLLHLLAGCADGCGIAAMATPVAVSYAAPPVGVGRRSLRPWKATTAVGASGSMRRGCGGGWSAGRRPAVASASAVRTIDCWRLLSPRRYGVPGPDPVPRTYRSTTFRTLPSRSITAIWLPLDVSSSRNCHAAMARRMPSVMDSPLRPASSLNASAVSVLKLIDSRALSLS